MSVTATTSLMTFEEFLALPDDDVDRELIRGELREKPMTMRNRRHSPSKSRISQHLCNWLDTKPAPAGLIASGEAEFRLKGSPDSGVGIDVAYVSAEVAAKNPEAAFFDGPPVLAVEILSPSDTQEDIDEKLGLYLESGVAVVWLVNPRFRTVTVYRPNAAVTIFSLGQELIGDHELPGVRVLVDRLF